MEREKKKPSDYPQFAFRLSDQATKTELEDLVEDVWKLLNSRPSPDGFKMPRNKIIVDALRIGLGVLKKKNRR